MNYIITLKADAVKATNNDSAVDEGYGMLSKYADSDKRAREKGAFERAMVKKHEADRR